MTPPLCSTPMKETSTRGQGTNTNITGHDMTETHPLCSTPMKETQHKRTKDKHKTTTSVQYTNEGDPAQEDKQTVTPRLGPCKKGQKTPRLGPCKKTTETPRLGPYKTEGNAQIRAMHEGTEN